MAAADGSVGGRCDAATVSVVIPCHSMRRRSQLAMAVESVRAQSPRPAEIVVSVDHNEELLDWARRELVGVTVLANQFAPGASGTRNTGVMYTATPLVAMLDDDARAHRGWLAGLIAPFAQTDVIGTGGVIRAHWSGARPSWFPDELLWTVVAGTGPPPHPVRVRNVWSASMAVRRAAFDAAGGFRLGYGKRGARPRPEDTELCLRMSRTTGGAWMYVPDAIVDHWVPRERTTLRYLMARCYHEGRGKVELIRLAGGARDFDLERRYLRRTLPRAFLRDLAAAVRGRGVSHAGRAAVVLAGTASAMLGGLIELTAGWADTPTPPIPAVSGDRGCADEPAVSGDPGCAHEPAALRRSRGAR